MSKQPSSDLERRQTFYVGSVLTLVTLILYWPASHYDFVVADDYQYVCDNSHVLKGLSWEGINWATWSMYAGNWHPVTWLSHMLDCSIYGLFAGGHHLTNVFFHTANMLLLFGLLKRLTGRLWPSAFVAAFFGWHPLHVESVAWICERKDVLSTFFLLLTIGAYERYVRRPTRGRYLLALLLFLFGLMAKPMLVTLPCLLLLLDYWPLRRFQDLSGKLKSPREWKSLVTEKVPFFLLSFFGCVMTVLAQSAGGAVKEMGEVSLLVRVVNAVSSYGRYLGKAFWPTDLVVFYPLSAEPGWGLFAGSLLVLVAVTSLAVRWRSRFPWLGVGWFWFLGTLVPVIGLIQVGDQAMADRYTYIPYIGLFVVVVWGVDYWMGRQRWRLWPVRVLAAGCLIGCFLVARNQLGYWQNSVTVFGHAAKLTTANKFSNGNLSYALAQQKRGPDPLPRYKILLRPDSILSKTSAPKIVFDTDSIIQVSDAVIELSEILNYDPRNATVHNNLGIVLWEQHKPDEAIEEFETASRLDDRSPWPRFNEALVLQERGRAREAASRYEEAIKLRPGSPGQATTRFLQPPAN